MFEHFPYTNMHELNLDWIIEQVKKAYSPDNPPDNLVLSVNGQTGEVVLYQDANVQLPSVESNQWNIYRLVASPNGQTARGIEFSGNGTARIINGTHRALIYTSENPPDYPVDSVNGQTGAVTIQVPFVNTTDELMQFATDSEDNYWGLRRNTTGGEAGIYLDTAGETVRAYITLMPEYEGEGTPQTFQLLTTNDIPESSGVVSVNGLTGVVRLFGTNIYRTDNSNQTINQALSSLEMTANALEDGIAIVANGNTHPAIASGQFVYIKNHSSLTEGLYTANSAIGTNVELTTSNVTADGSGGLNALKTKIGNVGNTDLQNQVTALNSNKANVMTGTPDAPEHGFLKISGIDEDDLIVWGGGVQGATIASNAGGILYNHASRRYAFRAKNTNCTHYHDYRLPICKDASSDEWYDILTTESFPFVRTNGSSPGGSNNQITFTAPGDGRHAIVCYAANMSHVFCVSKNDSVVYSNEIADGFTLTKSSGTYTLKRSSETVFSYTILWI